MKHNFDEIIDRRGTNCTSMEGFRGYIFHAGPDMKLPYKDEDYIRMWIADMEFATPECVVEGIQERLKHPIFGYTRLFSPEYYGIFSAWTKKMYDWTFPRGDLYICSGIIPALNELVGYATAPGDKVLIFTPSYTPFKAAADFHGRECVCSDLVDREHNGYFEIDFDDFRAKAADPAVKLLIFCNPHNPTGRIWTEEELRAVGEICRENGLLIISDEIHCDLLRSGRVHTPLAKLFPGSDQIITCMAPSKTFNLAGLHFSNIIIPNEIVRAGWLAKHNFNVNPLSLAAASAAYDKGYDWMMELREYLDGNFAFTKEYLSEHLPKAVFRIPDATYLGWVDIAAYLDERTKFIPLLFAEHAGVLLEGGNMFVQNSDTYIRLNVAAPRATLAEGLRRICDLLNSDVR